MWTSVAADAILRGMSKFDPHDPLALPVVADGYLDGAKRAAQKQASRDRDAAMLASGQISMEDLRRKNDIFWGVDFSKVRIKSIGGVPYEDLD